jgi:hypothetical protein
MSDEFRRHLETTCFTPEELTSRTRAIHEGVLRESKYLDGSNFRQIHPDDLALLFEQYDREFFQGECRKALGGSRLEFRLSRRMTSAGGKTTRFRPRRGPGAPWYEIAVSTTLLFQTFHDLDREIAVTGIPCHDRLEALQRIFEHELIHLAEMLVWTDSSCSAGRFQSIAHRLFGHTDHRHQLITPQERAFKKFRIHPGARVRFQMEGQTHVGVVNRVTQRATVLVEDPRGRPYSNGKRYRGFYVPLEMLELIEAEG